MHTTKSISIAECKEDQCACNVTFQQGSVGSRVLWRQIGRPVILTTTSISIFLEVRILSHLKRVSIVYFKLGGVLFRRFHLFIYINVINIMIRIIIIIIIVIVITIINVT